MNQEMLLYFGLGCLGLVLLAVALRNGLKAFFSLVRLGINLVLGVGGMIFFNSFAAITGMALPINVFTLFTTGILGLPGVLLLIALKYFFMV